MSVLIIRRWTCDGCGKNADSNNGWMHANIDGYYESNVGPIRIGPDRDFDFCMDCRSVIDKALKHLKAK